MLRWNYSYWFLNSSIKTVVLDIKSKNTKQCSRPNHVLEWARLSLQLQVAKSAGFLAGGVFVFKDIGFRDLFCLQRRFCLRIGTLFSGEQAMIL